MYAPAVRERAFYADDLDRLTDRSRSDSALTGCSTGGVGRAAGSADGRGHDTCRVAATGGRLELQNTLSGRATLLLPVSELDQRAFADCMRQRGYVEGSTD